MIIRPSGLILGPGWNIWTNWGRKKTWGERFLTHGSSPLQLSVHDGDHGWISMWFHTVGTYQADGWEEMK